MKTKLNNKVKDSIKKKSQWLNTNNNNNHLRYNYFNQNKNRNKISLILNFLDINEQLPLIKLNSIISKLIINKYNLPFKSILSLRQYKNNKNLIESKFSIICNYFSKVIKADNIEEEEYDFIISFLLKNINNKFIIVDKLNNDINKKIFFNFISKIKYIKNINHIKFILPNADDINEQSILEVTKKFCFINFFENINHLEIDKIENSFLFINQLINFEHNLINNIEKINLSNISIRIKNQLSLNLDNNNSLVFPKLTNLKYIFLSKINLSLSFLNLLINNNIKLLKLIINNCSYNNSFDINYEKENSAMINMSLNKCKNIKHIEFNNNNFSDIFLNQTINNLISLFYNQNNRIYFISCGFIFNKDFNLEDIYNNLINNSKKVLNNERYLNIKLSSSFIYRVNKNKNIIEVSNQRNDIERIKLIKYDKIKLCLYNTDNPSITNNIKEVMENYYINKSTKYLQIFSCFKNGELNQTKNIKIQYDSIEKFTLFFQNEEENITLYGNKIILSILMFFPCIKIISFKNINFQNDDKKFREYYDDLKTCFELILFGEKNEILSFYKNKKINLEEIKFSNCYYYQHLIKQYILDDINGSIYFNKKIKLTFAEYY